MLSFYVKAADVPAGGPLESVWVHPPKTTFAEAKDSAQPFKRYRRDIRLGSREILLKENWDEFYGVLNRKGFGKKQLRQMFDDVYILKRRITVFDQLCRDI